MELTSRNFWYESKALLKDLILISEGSMHVHLGLALFVIGALLLRKRKRGLLVAWLCVVVVQMCNELLDARDWINWTGTVNWTEFAKDTVSTLFWPSVLLLVWPLLSRRTQTDTKPV